MIDVESQTTQGERDDARRGQTGLITTMHIITKNFEPLYTLLPPSAET